MQRLVAQPQRSLLPRFLALKDVSFEVEQGEAVGIIGRNEAVDDS